MADRRLIQRGRWMPESSQGQTEPWVSGGTGAQSPEGEWSDETNEPDIFACGARWGWREPPTMGSPGLPTSPWAPCARARSLALGGSHVPVGTKPFLWGPATVGLPETIPCPGESDLAARGL